MGVILPDDRMAPFAFPFVLLCAIITIATARLSTASFDADDNDNDIDNDSVNVIYSSILDLCNHANNDGNESNASSHQHAPSNTSSHAQGEGDASSFSSRSSRLLAATLASNRNRINSTTVKTKLSIITYASSHIYEYAAYVFAINEIYAARQSYDFKIFTPETWKGGREFEDGGGDQRWNR